MTTVHMLPWGVLARSLMSSPVISVEPTASIGDAAMLMLSERISGLPVVRRDGSLVGMVTESDFLRRAELGTEVKPRRWLNLFVNPSREADAYVKSHGRKVEEVMSPDVITTCPDASLDEIVEAMTRNRIKRVPVVQAGKLVGIIARSDVLSALVRALPSGEGRGDDERIRAAIAAELARQSWASRCVRIAVHNGAVELSGTIFNESERMAVRVAAENVSGVTSVTDKMVWVEPISGMVIVPFEEMDQGADTQAVA
jgi:CBS domain-containing protein